MVDGPAGAAHQLNRLGGHRREVDVATSRSRLQIATAGEAGPLRPPHRGLVHDPGGSDHPSPVVDVTRRTAAQPLLDHDSVDVMPPVVGWDRPGDADPGAGKVVL